MTDQDMIRVWNEETREMMEPMTIQEMLCREHRVAIRECDDDLSHAHIVFMRNTGIYAATSKEFDLSTQQEIFAEDLVTHSTEPWLYRVAYRPGRWWALSLCQDNAAARPLDHIHNPRIVGNIFENRDLVLKGEINDE